MAQSLEGVVVQVHVGEVDGGALERIGIDGEVVIVRGNLNLAGLQLLHRMVAAVMSAVEFVGLAAESEADQLMTEADSEDGFAPHEAANILLGVVARLGIA